MQVWNLGVHSTEFLLLTPICKATIYSGIEMVKGIWLFWPGERERQGPWSVLTILFSKFLYNNFTSSFTVRLTTATTKLWFVQDVGSVCVFFGGGGWRANNGGEGTLLEVISNAPASPSSQHTSQKIKSKNNRKIPLLRSKLPCPASYFGVGGLVRQLQLGKSQMTQKVCLQEVVGSWGERLAGLWGHINPLVPRMKGFLQGTSELSLPSQI